MQQFHKIERRNVFFGREGRNLVDRWSWLRTAPFSRNRGGGREGKRELGVVYFSSSYTHIHTDTYAYIYEGEVVGWRVNDRTMSPVWCTRTLYDDSIWMESGVHSQCIENISSRISLLLGSVSIKGRIHLHSENDRLCDHRLRPPTRASTDRLLRKFDRRWHFRNSKLVMRFG